MVRKRILQLAKYATGTTAVAGVTFIEYRLLHVNDVTVALSLLLVVLFTAASWGLRSAIYVSVISTLAFNYFFLPPVLTLTIADTRNWVALLAFLVTAVSASHLSERARKEAEMANRRRHESERLYGFSQQMLVTENLAELLSRIPSDVTLFFEFTQVALFVSERNRIYRSSGDAKDLPAERLREAAKSRELILEGTGILYTPLMMGVRSIGSLGVCGTGTLPTRETIEALAGMIAIAVERAIALERLTRAEAARESERLRTALLDSITHELRTPLTAIKASITGVRETPGMTGEQIEELYCVIEEETDRLNRLIAEAVEMAQLDAREVKLDIHPYSIRTAIDAAVEELSQTLAENPVQTDLPESLPMVRMDLAYITKVVRHLLENAVKYSAPGTPISISAETDEGILTVNVADRGEGIDELEQSLIFDKFYRGRGQRELVSGTGMGLAIVRAIVEAHNGRITCTSQPGYGSVFSFTLPIAY
jgi:two-component system sensor histidine kinase KdpD